jgi:hypothetical protein
MGVIHVDSITRGAHLLPRFPSDVPVYREVNYMNVLDLYSSFYVVGGERCRAENRGFLLVLLSRRFACFYTSRLTSVKLKGDLGSMLLVPQGWRGFGLSSYYLLSSLRIDALP